MQLFNRKNAGAVDLDRINGATDQRRRPPEEFAPGGRGGMSHHEIGTMGQGEISSRYPEIAQQPWENLHDIPLPPNVDMSNLAKKIEARPPQLATLIGSLTFGELLQFAVETLDGKLSDNFDAMTASKEAQQLAAAIHVWHVLMENKEGRGTQHESKPGRDN